MNCISIFHAWVFSTQQGFIRKRTIFTVYANIIQVLDTSTTFTDLLHLLYFSEYFYFCFYSFSVSQFFSSNCFLICLSVFTDIFLCFYKYLSLFLPIYSSVSTDIFLCFYRYLSLFLLIYSMFSCFYRFIPLFPLIYSIFFCFYRSISLFLLIYPSFYTDLFFCFYQSIPLFLMLFPSVSTNLFSILLFLAI